MLSQRMYLTKQISVSSSSNRPSFVTCRQGAPPGSYLWQQATLPRAGTQSLPGLDGLLPAGKPPPTSQPPLQALPVPVTCAMTNVCFVTDWEQYNMLLSGTMLDYTQIIIANHPHHNDGQPA